MTKTVESRRTTATSEKERAERNRDDTLRLLQVKARKREFVEIGRLLSECEEQQHFRTLDYRSFKEYVESCLKTDYPAATRDKRTYELMRSSGDISPDTVRNIGKGKMRLLLRLAERDRVTPELWKRAEVLTFEELRRLLKRYRPQAGLVAMTGEEHSRHKDVQEKIREIGENLGKYAQTEYPSYPSKQYLFDVVWKTFEQAVGVTHVFEVCWGSPFKGDLPKLSYAYRWMGQPHLFLVVANEEDKRNAKSLVSSGTMPGDATQNLAIRTVQEIEQLYKDFFEPGSLREFVDLFLK